MRVRPLTNQGLEIPLNPKPQYEGLGGCRVVPACEQPYQGGQEQVDLRRSSNELCLDSGLEFGREG